MDDCEHVKICGICAEHHYFCLSMEGCGLECDCWEAEKIIEDEIKKGREE